MLHYNLMQLVRIKLINFTSNLNTNIQDTKCKTIRYNESVCNTAELNKVSALNAKNATAVADANAQRQLQYQYNKTLDDARERFNVENQRVIDQSNVTWRRSINTANTSTVNAANQTNATKFIKLK